MALNQQRVFTRSLFNLPCNLVSDLNCNIDLGMDSTMSAYVSMVTQMFGNNSLSYLTTYHSLLWWRTRSSVSTEVSHPALTPSIRLSNWIECRRRPMKVPFATYSGQIPMKDVDGEFHPEALDTLSAKTSQNSLTTPIAWRGLQGRTSWSWLGITGHMTGMWSLYSRHQTTATGVVMMLPLWKWMNTWSLICKFGSLFSPSVWVPSNLCYRF